MQNRLRISLVIPAHNEESHLANCLAAALHQTQPFWEIIVVDNDSADGTVAVAQSFAGVTVLHEAQLGIVYARNRGFNYASGDIIARIDADTILPANWAAHVRAFYEDSTHANTAWTCSGHFTDVPMPRVVSAGYKLVAVHINHWLTGYPTLWGSSMALPTALWRRVAAQTCHGNGFHEDLDLTTHLYRAGSSIFWDKNMRVTAQLRHAWISSRDLWEYLQWWPRTLRRHHQKTWIICWLGGALAMYGATLCLAFYLRFTRRTATTQVPSALEV